MHKNIPVCLMEISEDGRLGNYKKGNYGSSYQQSLNEIFATNLHKAQGFDNYTEYLLTTMDVESGIEGIGCMSYAFQQGRNIWKE